MVFCDKRIFLKLNTLYNFSTLFLGLSLVIRNDYSTFYSTLCFLIGLILGIASYFKLNNLAFF